MQLPSSSFFEYAVYAILEQNESVTDGQNESVKEGQDEDVTSAEFQQMDKSEFLTLVTLPLKFYTENFNNCYRKTIAPSIFQRWWVFESR